VGEPAVIARLAASWWARLAITAAILGWLATRIDMAAAARAVFAVSPGHLVAVLALVAADRAVMIWRWILLLRARGVPVATAQAVRVFPSARSSAASCRRVSAATPPGRGAWRRSPRAAARRWPR
jgi:hypothetical protein